MKRSSVPTVVLVAAAALVALLVYGVIQQQSGPSDALDKAVQDGKLPPAPSQQLARPGIAAGPQRSLADFRGKVVVVNFWASWCGPCKTEAPVLNRAQADLSKRGDGTVVGVTYQDAADASRGFAKENGFAFPTLRDPDEALFSAYGNRGIPETFVLDKRGRVVALSRGAIDDAFLAGALEKARAAA